MYDDGTERLGCDSARDRGGSTQRNKADFILVRWVNAIWTVLERTHPTLGAERPSSLRVNRAASSVSNSDGGGSASAHYVPRPSHPAPGSEDQLSPSPFAGPSRPMFTTDDAVIQTSGGLTAPLAERGSRRLAAGGLERGRSLRRVASEGDLSDVADMPETFDLEADVLEVPLTAESAREGRPSSRDFTFARGISPPPLSPLPLTYRTAFGIDPPFGPNTTQGVLSPNEALPPYRTPTTSQANPAPVYQTIEVSTRERMSTTETGEALASTIAMPKVFTSAPDVTAAQATTTCTVRPENTLAGTAAEYTSTSVLQRHPQLAATEMSPSDESGATRTALDARTRLSYYTSPSGTELFAATAGSAYTTAPQTLGSPFQERSIPRPDSAQDSVSSYASAPPPVPSRDSRYDTATFGPGSRQARPVRYQLHDPPYSSASQEDQSEYITGPQPDSAPTASRLSAAYQTALSYNSPASEYITAPTPPLSPSMSPSALSFRSDLQEQAETATYISEPESDADLIAELERRSTAGTQASRSTRHPGNYAKSEYSTAETRPSSRSSSGNTPLRETSDNSQYFTARDTAYATAPSWHTQSTYVTAMDTQA